MNIYKIHADSLADLEAEQDDACPLFTWNGADWLCLPGGAKLSKDLASGGFNLNSDARFTVLFSQFCVADSVQYPDAMAVKDAMLEDELGYLGDQYKIVSVTIMGNGLQLHIEANSLSQGSGS